MPPRRRRLIAVTLLSVLTVTGLVIGCDSDDGPEVTPPAGNGGSGNGNGTRTRDENAEKQGREWLEVGDHTIRNKNEEGSRGEVYLAIRVDYGNGSPTHYRLNPSETTLRDIEGRGTNPTILACSTGLRFSNTSYTTARANGECWKNDGTGVLEDLPSRDTSAENPSGLEETDNGRKIENTNTGGMTIRFNYPEPKYYFLRGGQGWEMSSDPEGTGTPPTRVVCLKEYGQESDGDKIFPLANGECWNRAMINGAVFRALPHRSTRYIGPPISGGGGSDGGGGGGGSDGGGGGGGSNGVGRFDNSRPAAHCVEPIRRERGFTFGEVRNRCGRSIVIDGACGGPNQRWTVQTQGRWTYSSNIFYGISPGSSSVLGPGETTIFTEGSSCSGRTIHWIACYGTLINGVKDVRPAWLSSSHSGSYNCVVD